MICPSIRMADVSDNGEDICEKVEKNIKLKEKKNKKFYFLISSIECYTRIKKYLQSFCKTLKKTSFKSCFCISGQTKRLVRSPICLLQPTISFRFCWTTSV